jgi:quercetin dioxygenase-like cupin family protein
MKHYLQITAAMLALGFTVGSARAEDAAPVKITELLKRDHPELADKEVVVKRIELQPGASAPPHVHPGMVTGYVETGVLEFQLKGEPLLKLKAGDTFFEPPGSHHMVARNPDATTKTVVIAFVVNPKGAPLSTPLEGHGDSKH